MHRLAVRNFTDISSNRQSSALSRRCMCADGNPGSSRPIRRGTRNTSAPCKYGKCLKFTPRRGFVLRCHSSRWRNRPCPTPGEPVLRQPFICQRPHYTGRQPRMHSVLRKAYVAARLDSACRCCCGHQAPSMLPQSHDAPPPPNATQQSTQHLTAACGPQQWVPQRPLRREGLGWRPLGVHSRLWQKLC